jgi:hypothetical protein
MSTGTKKAYNQRLFSGGLRKWIHQARFHWLNGSLRKLDCIPSSVIELGCYDAKTIHFLPDKPLRYVGLDANWEKGLDLARELWKEEPGYEFFYCRKPEDVHISGLFDISICMETLEHVPSDLVDPYLEFLSAHTGKYTFITVPIEKGLVFATKYLIKKIGRMEAEPYTLAEFSYATLGRMDKIPRHEHRGFDYSVMIQSVAKFFDILNVSSYPIPFLPLSLGFGVGVIGKPKRSPDTENHKTPA